VLVTYLATLVDWSDKLSFERGLALIVAPSVLIPLEIAHDSEMKSPTIPI
jgi:hypothetical protein